MNSLTKKIKEISELISPLYRASYEDKHDVGLDAAEFKGEGEHDVGLDAAKFKQVKKLATEIHGLAIKAGLDSKLPSASELKAELTNAPSWLQFETSLKLPGWWQQGPLYVLYPMPTWLDALRDVGQFSLNSTNKSVTANRKSVGRPKSTEKTSDVKVISALKIHHDYNEGSIGNYEPATNLQISKLAGMGNNCLSRFLERKLEAKNGAHTRYKTLCNNKTIGNCLRLWSGEMPSRDITLRGEEYDKG